MTEQEAIAETAAKYREEGYAVSLNPDPAALPVELRERRPTMLAVRNGESVVVEVWSRDRINDLPPTFLPAGWKFDVVVLPQFNGDGPYAPATPKPTRDYVEKLLDELETCLPLAAVRARFLLAWSAVESAMRVTAEEVGIDLQGMGTRQLISELASAGLISPSRYSSLQRQFEIRNRLAHGVPTGDSSAIDVAGIASLARELIAEKPVPAA
jgi:hypothetical protein